MIRVTEGDNHPSIACTPISVVTAQVSCDIGSLGSHTCCLSIEIYHQKIFELTQKRMLSDRLRFGYVNSEHTRHHMCVPRYECVN